MIDMSLEGTNGKGIWNNSSKQVVPKPRFNKKEAVRQIDLQIFSLFVYLYFVNNDTENIIIRFLFLNNT